MALYVSKVSEELIRTLAQEYLVDNQTMKSVARRHATSPATVSNILFRGVTEGILDEATSVAITKKAVANTDNIRKTYKRWEKASKLREIHFIKQDIAFSNQLIEQLKFQIENYTDYFFDDDCAPSKKSLRCNKAKTQRQLDLLKERLKKLESECK